MQFRPDFQFSGKLFSFFSLTLLWVQLINTGFGLTTPKYRKEIMIPIGRKNLCICLLAYLFIVYLFIYFFVYLLICLYILSFRLFIYLFICLVSDV